MLKFITLYLLAPNPGVSSPASYNGSRGRAQVRGLPDFLKEVQSYSWILATPVHGLGRASRPAPVLLQPCGFSPVYPTASASAEDGYVPMGPQVATSALRTHCSHDDYIPMSPGSISSPLPELPADMEPPPVNRDLKPQRKRKPRERTCCAGEGRKVLEATCRSFLLDRLWEEGTGGAVPEAWEV